MHQRKFVHVNNRFGMTRNGPGALHFILHLFLVMSFITAGISPACKFISGTTSFFEICGVEEISQAPLPEEFAAYFNYRDEQENKDHKLELNEQCSFCFAQTHLDKIVSGIPDNIVYRTYADSGPYALPISPTIVRYETALLAPQPPPTLA